MLESRRRGTLAILVTLIAALVPLVAAPPAAAAEGELVPNGGFETAGADPVHAGGLAPRLVG